MLPRSRRPRRGTTELLNGGTGGGGKATHRRMMCAWSFANDVAVGCVRAVVRSALSNHLRVKGIRRGFEGLIPIVQQIIDVIQAINQHDPIKHVTSRGVAFHQGEFTSSIQTVDRQHVNFPIRMQMPDPI